LGSEDEVSSSNVEIAGIGRGAGVGEADAGHVVDGGGRRDEGASEEDEMGTTGDVVSVDGIEVDGNVAGSDELKDDAGGKVDSSVGVTRVTFIGPGVSEVILCRP
jgi:hypothetical protein